MNFEYYIYQYLLKHQKAEVPDFGVFELIKESAKIDAENSVIIPPKELVTFRYEPTVSDNRLAKYISDETNSDIFAVHTNLKNEIEKWFRKLETENILNLENLGQLQWDEQNKVTKITDNNADVFGLEEINLQNLKNFRSRKTIISEDYSFSRKVIWTFLSIIIVGSVSLFLFGDQQLIFGKSSQIPAKKIIKKTKLKTYPVLKQDSIKKDNIKTY